ncbi:MAG: hypothetical protein IJH71_08910 [Eubacterium sp.]|nr:hypothetical protein [Eubacterium sp.]
MSRSEKYEVSIDDLEKAAGGYDWNDPESLCDPADPYWIPGEVILPCEMPMCGGRLIVRYIHNGNGIIKDYQPYATCPVCGYVRSIKPTDIEYPEGAPA